MILRQAFWTGLRRSLIHGPWAFKTSRNRLNDPLVTQMQGKIKLPRAVAEDPYPSSKLKAAVRIVKELLKDNETKAPKDQVKVLIYTKWTNMKDIVDLVSGRVIMEPSLADF